MYPDVQESLEALSDYVDQPTNGLRRTELFTVPIDGCD